MNAHDDRRRGGVYSEGRKYTLVRTANLCFYTRYTGIRLSACCLANVAAWGSGHIEACLLSGMAVAYP